MPDKANIADWQVMRPSYAERLRGVPEYRVTLTGDTPDAINEAFADACDKMGWDFMTATASKPTHFEVQGLKVDGDRIGHWDAMTGAMSREAADERAAELRQDGHILRVVPFGTGPNPRLSDVVPRGMIYCGREVDRDVDIYAVSGRVVVTPEQADNAARFNWKRTGECRDGGTVVIERAAG